MASFQYPGSGSRTEIGLGPDCHSGDITYSWHRVKNGKVLDKFARPMCPSGVVPFFENECRCLELIEPSASLTVAKQRALKKFCCLRAYYYRVCSLPFDLHSWMRWWPGEHSVQLPPVVFARHRCGAGSIPAEAVRVVVFGTRDGETACFVVVPAHFCTTCVAIDAVVGHVLHRCSVERKQYGGDGSQTQILLSRETDPRYPKLRARLGTGSRTPQGAVVAWHSMGFFNLTTRALHSTTTGMERTLRLEP